jgi:hypothetical protein
VDKLPIRARGQSVRFAECAAEGVEALEAALLADLADVEFAALQEFRRLAQAALAHVTAKADAEPVAKHGPQMAHAVAEFVRQMTDGHGLVEMLADVAIDVLQDYVADIVARVDVAAFAGDFRKRGQTLEQTRERVGKNEMIGFLALRIDEFADQLIEEIERLFVEDAGRVAQGQDSIGIVTLEGDEQPLQLSSLRIHEVMELVWENERALAGLKQIGMPIDPGRTATFEHSDELEAVMVIVADAFRLEEGGVSSLEEDDIVGRESLLDAGSAEQAGRRRQLAHVFLEGRRCFARVHWVVNDERHWAGGREF